MALLLLLAVGWIAQAGAVTNLDTGRVYSAIQHALNDDATLDGHTIEINSSLYDSANEPGGNPFAEGTSFIAVWKAVTVRSTGGAEHTVLDGSGHSVVITMCVDDSTLEGFTITGAEYGIGGLEFAAGVELGEVSNVSIRDNIVTGNEHFGISLWKSDGCDVSGNVVSHITHSPEADWAGYGIVVAWSDSNQIVGNTIQNLEGLGIEINGGSHNTVHGNAVTQTVKLGIHVRKAWEDDIPATHNQITQNTISNTKGNGWAAAIDLNRADLNAVQDNTLENNQHTGIHLFESEGNEIIGNTISNTSLPPEGDFGAGIHLSQSSDNQLRNNTVADNAARGIILWRSDGCVLSGNTVTGTTLPDGETWGGHGIELPWSNDTHVYNNTVEDNYGIGIVVNGASYNTVQNNNVVGNGLAGGQGAWGINIHSWDGDDLILAQGNQLIGNNISNTNGGGIVIGSAVNNLVQGNVVTGNIEGIVVSMSIAAPADDNTITGNTFDGNAWRGIRIDPGNSRIEITDNIIRNTRSEFNGFVYGIGIMLLGWTERAPHQNYTITDNHVHDNAFGMMLSTVVNSEIARNTVENNDEAGPGFLLWTPLYHDDVTWWYLDSLTDSGGGIFLSGQGNRLANNTVTGNGFGIEIQGGVGNWLSRENVIEGNTITGNDSGTVTVRLEKWEWVENGDSAAATPATPARDDHRSRHPEESWLGGPDEQPAGHWERTEVIVLAEATGFGLAVINASENDILDNTFQDNGDVGLGFLGFDEPAHGLVGHASQNVARRNVARGHEEGLWYASAAPDNVSELSTFTSNNVGVMADTATANIVRYSQIVGNAISGVRNSVPESLDARHNWWGSAGGPGVGGANGVHGNVRFDPWWPTATGTGAAFEVMRETGDVLTPGAFYGSGFHAGSADLAEWVKVSEPVEPGHVLEIDPEGIGQYRLARGPCTPAVAGVVSTAPGMVLGSPTAHHPLPTTHHPPPTAHALLALLGVVPVKVTDEGGPIAIGDLLVVSSTPGHAMRWDPESGEPCGLVGKALEPLEESDGIVRVLLTR